MGILLDLAVLPMFGLLNLLDFGLKIISFFPLHYDWVCESLGFTLMMLGHRCYCVLQVVLFSVELLTAEWEVPF